ncbi:M14 family zinc carboxypeptidase [Bacillus marinisedimentorum]|uniref:M14 family zinc carboxypeptidase n=1 Tax=Bacillus marinisedimentorum TaxID=1821260 RepID=UPI0008730127|nr:M14 family zinc carboxypeptidase [Bacillus marinisedimentorum]
MNKFLKVAGPTTLALSLAFSSAAFANPQSKPNGPWVENEQNLSFSSFMTNEQLYKTLEKLERSSQGKMELEIAGYSNVYEPDNYWTDEEKGDPIYLAKFGDNDPDKKKILITTQIHGNEQVGTEGAIDLMQKLAAGGKEVEEILDKVSIWFLPRINPEGSMNQYEGEWYPARYTHQTWNPEALGLPADTLAPWYYNADGSERAQNNNGRVVYGIPGYDQNRDYNPNLDFRVSDYSAEEVAGALNDKDVWKQDENGNWFEAYNGKNSSDFGGYYVTAESRIVTDVFKQFEPDVFVDVHHRYFNTLSDDDNRQVSIQVAADVAGDYTDPFSGKQYSVDEDVLTLGKQVNAVAHDSLQRGFSSFGAIQKYPKVDLPGTALGAFALNDTSIMLIELKGQSQNLGQKQTGMLKSTVSVPIYEVARKLADGSIHEVDPAIYDNIPEGANSISDPTTREDF